MRNDSAKWPAPVAEGLDWQGDGVRLRHLTGLVQTLVSGADVLDAFGPSVGWPEPARAETYAVALRRDRVLLVNGPELAEGWDAETGRAVSDMSGGFIVFELSGPRLPALLLRGAEMLPSRSAQRHWAGLDVILYHHEPSSAVRVHVQRAQAEAFAETVQRRLRAMTE